MLGPVVDEGREVDVATDGRCGWRAVTEPRRVPNGHLEVITSLPGDRLDDRPQAVSRARQGNPTGSVNILAEGSVAPDVLRERPDMIDVLEALANGFVSEPLADRLRRVPAVDEEGAGETEAAAPRWKVVHSRRPLRFPAARSVWACGEGMCTTVGYRRARAGAERGPGFSGLR